MHISIYGQKDIRINIIVKTQVYEKREEGLCDSRSKSQGRLSQLIFYPNFFTIIL